MSIPHLPCPVLAASVTNRGFALVCLDARFRLVGIRAYDLHRHRKAVDAKVHAVRTGATWALREFGPASVVVERGGRTRRTKTHDVLTAALVEAAASHGLATSTATFRDACLRIGGTRSSAKTVAILRGQYHALSVRLAERPERAPLDHERYRRFRPVIGALAIAHVVVLDELTAGA
jgi:hypothetical protein